MPADGSVEHSSGRIKRRQKVVAAVVGDGGKHAAWCAAAVEIGGQYHTSENERNLVHALKETAAEALCRSDTV